MARGGRVWWRRLVAAVAVVLVTGALAACGGDDGEAAGTTAPPTTATTAATDTTAAPEEQTIEVYLLAEGGNCDDVEAVTRTATGGAVLTSALEELLAGPTQAERDGGLGSWFSADTAGMLGAVAVEGGVAEVAFARQLPDRIPNASTSCGSAGLLAQLDATVTQFATVERAVYSLDGDVAAFYEWLQLSPPEA